MSFVRHQAFPDCISYRAWSLLYERSPGEMTDTRTGFRSTTDRRASPRIRGSALPWLRVWTGRSTNVEILDISDGGALIETPHRVTPGEREVLVLNGHSTTKMVGWAERVEITRLVPAVTYRAAIRFALPARVGTLWSDPEPSADGVSRQLMNRFAILVRGLSCVRAVRVSSSCLTRTGTEPVHFAVPTSRHGEGRLLQVFFSSGALPTAGEFAELRRMAVVASDLPDFDITSFNSRESASASPARQRKTA